MQYRLRRSMGHFTGERFPEGTVVEGRPYPVDPDYLEVTLPDGVMLTVRPGSDVEPVVAPLTEAEKADLRVAFTDGDLGRAVEFDIAIDRGREHLIVHYDYADGGSGLEAFSVSRNLSGKLEVGDDSDFDWGVWYDPEGF